MADNTIDSLAIEISSNIGNADKAIDRLAGTLLNLQKKLGGFQKIGFGNLSGGIKQLGAATKGVDIAKLSNYSAALNNLGNSVRSFSGLSKQVAPAIKNLEKLSGFDFTKLQIKGDFTGLSELSKGVGEYAKAASELATLKPTDINRAVKSFEKLAGMDLTRFAQGAQMLNGVDFSALGNLGASFQNFTASLAGADKVASGTAKIFSSLSQLTISAENIPLIQRNLPLLSNEIVQFISAMATAPAVQSGAISLVSALSGISSAGTKMQKTITALPGLTAGIKGFVEALSEMPALNDNIVRTVESLAKIAPSGATAGTAAKNLQKNITSLSSSMNGLRIGTNGTISGLKNFSKQILSALGIAGGLYAFVSGVKKSIAYASDLTEAQNVVEQGFGDLSYMADEFADSAIRSFGMSKLAAKKTAGQYAAMAKSLGVVPDKAAEMAVSLAGLSGDLASFWNKSQDVSKTALTSVFTGETESLKDFSIILTEANLQQFAYAQGINKSISAMTQAEKVQLRYLYVMDAAKVAAGDFARTAANSWANQIRILAEQFRELARIIGNVFEVALLPVVKVINNVIAKIIQLSTVLSSFFGKLFGFQKDVDGAGAGMGEIAEAAASTGASLGDAADGISNASGAASKGSKALNKYVAAWHEVNSMSSESESGAAGGGSGGASLADMNLPDKYELTVTVEDEVSPTIEKIRDRFLNLKSLFVSGFKFGMGDTSVFDSIRQNLRSIRENLTDIFTDSEVGDAFNSLLDTLAFNAGAKMGAFTSIGASILDNITGGVALYLDDAKERIKGYLIDMFNIIESRDTIVTNFGVALAEIATVFRSDSAKNITASIIQIFADGFMGATELAAKLGRDILGTILNPITENTDGFKEALENTLAPLSTVLGTLADSFTHTWEVINQTYDEHVAPLFQSLSDGISEIVGTLLNGYNQYIAPVLTKLADRFQDVWAGTIQPLLDNFIGLFGDVADLIKTVWETILQPVINWVASKIMPVVAPVLEAMGSNFLNTFEMIGNLFNDFLISARGVITFLDGAFSGDWEKAWEGIKNTFKGIWDAMPDFVKTPIRNIIGLVNKMIEGIEGGINYVIAAMNRLSFDVPDWVPGVGGETFGFNLNKISLGRIPQLALGGVINSATLAMIGENGAEAVVPLEKNTRWISMVSDQMAQELSSYKLDLAIPSTDFNPRTYNPGALQRTMQMEMDAKMAEMSYEEQRKNTLLEQILSAVEEKQLVVGDKAIFEANRRETLKFGKQTRHDPYPIYGKSW